MKPSRLTADAFASALVAASFLQALEGILPRIPLFPWLKLGISYAVVLPFLACYGALPTAALLVARNALGWLMAGVPFSSFLIGTVATGATFIILGPVVRLGMSMGAFGYLGAGIALATALNLAQLAVVDLMFIRHAGFFFQIPAMLLWSAASGALSAWFAAKAAPWLEKSWSQPWPAAETSSAPVVDTMKPLRRRMIFIVSWLRLIPILALPFLRVQILMLLVTGCIIYFRKGPGLTPAQRWKPFRPLLKVWPLLLFQAWLHLFNGEGTFIAQGFVTREGLHAFFLQALRLYNVILIGPRLAMAFPRAALSRSASPYLMGLGMAWERIPTLLTSWRENAQAFLDALRHGDVSPVLERMNAKKL